MTVPRGTGTRRHLYLAAVPGTMDLDFDDMTPLSGVAALVVLAGTAVLLYAQFHIGLLSLGGSLAPGGATLSAETRETLAHYRGVRLAGGGVMAAGVAVFLFDLAGGTARVLRRLRD